MHQQIKLIRLILPAIVCFGLAPMAQAVGPDTDGAIPGANHGEGIGVLMSRTEGVWNTGIGFEALNQNTVGGLNTAAGIRALFSNTTGSDNTASGVYALHANVDGSFNNAVGAFALGNNTAGNDNTALGTFALLRNTEGSWNTALGSQALLSNTSFDNTAIGFRTLSSNINGSSNTAIGSNALLNSLGSFNVGIGRDVLGTTTSGNSNTAVGYGALFTDTTGSNNTALGAFAGKGVATANSVICIGHGVLGANVSNSTWIGGIWGVTPQSGNTAPVVVSDGGQLGTVASAERFKKDIATMDNASEGILSLRPVTFHYKSDARETPQFGLIAEEVAKVNPALVLTDQEGKPYTVRYDVVNSMLLNEFLKEHHKVQELEAALGALNKRLAEQDAKIQKVSTQLEMSKPASQTVLNDQ